MPYKTEAIFSINFVSVDYETLIVLHKLNNDLTIKYYIYSIKQYIKVLSCCMPACILFAEYTANILKLSDLLPMADSKLPQQDTLFRGEGLYLIPASLCH